MAQLKLTTLTDSWTSDTLGYEFIHPAVDIILYDTENPESALYDITTFTVDVITELEAAIVSLDITLSDAGDVNIPAGTVQDEIASAVGTVYGTERHYGDSDAESTTTSTTFQTKVTFTTSNLPSGTYRLEWAFEASNASNGVLSEYRVWDHTSTYANPTMEADNDYLAFAGFKEFAASGVKTFSLEYKRQGGTCKIRNARLSLIRVA